jgi:GGDEF domain-containing protein
MRTSTTQQQRTAAAIQARHHVAESMVERVNEALRQIRRERAKVTFAAVARRAAVSRTFLYQNPRARALVEQSHTEATDREIHDQAQHATWVEASWRERALNAEDATMVADRIVTALQRPFDLDGQTCHVTASTGVAIYQDGDTADTTIRSADEAMYTAKGAGKNHYAVSAA